MHYYYKISLSNENTDMAYCAFVVKSPPNIPSNQLVVKTKQDIGSTTYYEFVYWPDRSVSDLGYLSKLDDLFQSMINELIGGNYSKTFMADVVGNSTLIPGEYGAWGANGGLPSSGTSGENNSALCGTSYNSPLPNPDLDVQLDSFCAMAYALRCLDGKPLSDPQIQAACETYRF